MANIDATFLHSPHFHKPTLPFDGKRLYLIFKPKQDVFCFGNEQKEYFFKNHLQRNPESHNLIKALNKLYTTFPQNFFLQLGTLASQYHTAKFAASLLTYFTCTLPTLYQ
jgi:hypothetical protein